MANELLLAGAVGAGLLLLRQTKREPEFEPDYEAWRRVTPGQSIHLPYGTRLYKPVQVPYYPGGGQVQRYRTEWQPAELVTDPGGIDATAGATWREKTTGLPDFLLVYHSSWQGSRGIPLAPYLSGGSGIEGRIPLPPEVKYKGGGEVDPRGGQPATEYSSPVLFWTHKTASGYVLAGAYSGVRFSRGDLSFPQGIVEVAVSLPAGHMTREPERWLQSELNPDSSDFLSGISGGFNIPLGMIRAGVLTSDCGRLLGLPPERAAELEAKWLEDRVNGMITRRARLLCRFPNSNGYLKRWEVVDDPAQSGWPVVMESLGYLFPDGTLLKSR